MCRNVKKEGAKKPTTRFPGLHFRARAVLSLNASRRAGMGKRGHRGKKDGEGTKPPAEKKRSVLDVTELFVKGGDIKDLGRRATGAFTADALEKRYKHEGTTVDVDKNFSFKNLVTETGGGGSFSLFGASAKGGDADVAKTDADGAREEGKHPSAADARARRWRGRRRRGWRGRALHVGRRRRWHRARFRAERCGKAPRGRRREARRRGRRGAEGARLGIGDPASGSRFR